MAIEISSGGITKRYRYYPYDALYVDANGNINTNGNGQQVKEAWFNGVKYYPVGAKPDFRLELRFASSPHHFDKTNVAPRSSITNDANYYQQFSNVDENQWIYSNLTVHTLTPPRSRYGISTSYEINKSIVFPNSFGINNSTQKFAFELDTGSKEGIYDSAYNINTWPYYYVLGNYDEYYCYSQNNTVHTSKYYIHNGLGNCLIKAHINFYKEVGEQIYFSSILNSNRSYEFYVYSSAYDTSPRLVAEYSNGNLTVHEGYIYKYDVSASDEVAELLQHAGVSQLPTYNSH